jgi:hypothetical protein
MAGQQQQQRQQHGGHRGRGSRGGQHHDRGQRVPEREPGAPVEGCWFCLSSEQVGARVLYWGLHWALIQGSVGGQGFSGAKGLLAVCSGHSEHLSSIQLVGDATTKVAHMLLLSACRLMWTWC